MTYEILSSSSSETEAIASSLGSKLRGSETIVLVSDLGGGKTTFVRGLAAGMGSKDHVASPTFTISREYNATDLTMYHFDFYRLQEPGIVAAELQEFVNDPKAVVVIEWGAIVADVLPDDKIIIELVRRTETSRTIKISCTQKLKYICKDLA